MSEQSQIGYVRTQEAPAMPPPASEVGWQGWLRQNIFASMSDFSSIGAALSSLLMIVMTVGVLYFGLTVLWEMVRFSIVDAIWTDPEEVKRLACATTQQGGPLPADWSGACWPFVDAKWKVFTYGRYPESELWRPDLVMLIGGVAVAWMVSDAVPRRFLVGAVLLAAGAVLFWWSMKEIPNDTAALLNDQYDPEMASPLGKMFDRTPIGAWILCAVGILYMLLAKPVWRGAVALFSLTVLPVIAYILLTGGDAEGGTGFWISLAAIAAFGLLLWFIGRFMGDNGLSALLLSALVLAVVGYLLLQWKDGLTSMAITLPLPAELLQKITAGIGVLGLLFLITAGRGINMLVRIVLAVPAIVMIAGAYGAGPNTSVSLPVGWVILGLLLLGVVGFALMALVGMGRSEWHSAIGSFGRSWGKGLFLTALIIGVVAFVGGHWMVDLIELAAKGEIGKFLSPEHLAAHVGHGVHAAAEGAGASAATVTPLEIPREIWPLPEVETDLWGGLLVTLVVAITGIVASLPLGVLLALGRRSQLPAVRILSVVFIEFWRGVPLITVLFMSSVMLPLFLPEGTEFNKLLRALIGVALFSSAYMAEVVRGGLQAIPKGQYEGADSLGLGYGQKMRLIVMPQALTLVIPGIVNTFIGLFKDTVLVLIIGLFDLLGVIQSTFTDASWSTPVTNPTGYLTAAAIFWIFCFGMSRYSMFMERRLRRGHAR